MREQAARDGGLTGNQDPYVSFYHDVPRSLAEEAMSKERSHPSEASQSAPWALDALPGVQTKFVLCTETASSRPTSSGGKSPSACASRPMRSWPATASRSAARKSWRSFSSGTHTLVGQIQGHDTRRVGGRWNTDAVGPRRCPGFR